MAKKQVKDLEETINSVKINISGSYTKNYDAALDMVKKKSEYTGSFDDVKARNKYFSHFEVHPIAADKRAMGVLIEYAIRQKTSVEKKERKSTTGSGPVGNLYKI